MSKKKTNEIEELIKQFPAFRYQGILVTPCCDNCFAENCLKESSYLGLCKNYKFSLSKFECQ